MKWNTDEIGEGRTIFLDHGVAYVLPALEGKPNYVRRIGSFGVGFHVRWSSWSVGFDVLQAGLLLQFGPTFLWVAHIEKQSEAMAAKDTP